MILLAKKSMTTSDSLEDMVSDLRVKVENNRKILLSILGICVSIMAVAISAILNTVRLSYDVSLRGSLVVVIVCFSYLTYSLVVKHGFWRIESFSPKIKGRWVSIKDAPIYNTLMILLLSHLTGLHLLSVLNRL
jgi:hypothetical protein